MMAFPPYSLPFRLPARLAAGLLTLLLVGLVAVGSAFAASVERLTIDTARGPLEFQVEMARTPAERAKGLMYRTELAPDAGMLFDFEFDQQVSMWMKNTYIPLDMLFIRADGQIATIAADTTPLSTQTVSSGVKVRAVLELPAGTAKARGIAVGDQVNHDMFGTR